jgi:hypothetical protein
MLAKCGILQGNPTRRVVNIGRVTPVAASAVDAPDLAGSRRGRAGGWSADGIGLRWAPLMRLIARHGRVGYVS